MNRKPDPMTLNEYDECTVLYGGDLLAWPEEMRLRARAFLPTAEGQHAVMLDRVFQGAASQIQGAGMSQVGDTASRDAFIRRLQAIPDKHPQSPGAQDRTSPQDGGPRGVVADGYYRWLGQLFDPARFWSPAGFAAQGAVAALLLSLGVFVGAQQGPDALPDTLANTVGDYDISAGLFDESSLDNQEYAIDE